MSKEQRRCRNLLRRFFGFDTGLKKRHEPNIRIRFFNAWPFVKARVFPTIWYSILVLVVSCGLCALFALAYRGVFEHANMLARLSAAGVDGGFLSYFAGSFLIIEGFPQTFTGLDYLPGLSLLAQG